MIWMIHPQPPGLLYEYTLTVRPASFAAKSFASIALRPSIVAPSTPSVTYPQTGATASGQRFGDPTSWNPTFLPSLDPTIAWTCPTTNPSYAQDWLGRNALKPRSTARAGI